MRSIIILIFFSICVSLVSCEDVQEVFSIDQCLGEYVCKIKGQTGMVLPPGITEVPDPPLTDYPNGEIAVTVTKTGECELSLSLIDRTLVAHVDEAGNLTIPETTIHLENENFSMTLDAIFVASSISQKAFSIIQVATGETACNYKGEKINLIVTNIQTFAGTKKR